MSKRLLLLAMSVLLSVFVAVGCGSDGSDGKDANVDDIVGEVIDIITGGDDSTIATSSACITCHNGIVLEQHLASKHVVHSTHVSAASGAECQVCHNPSESGRIFEAYVNAADIPAGGLAAVGCVDCHKNGANHISAPGKFKPDAVGTAECATCHTKLPDNHLVHHPYADEIGERFAASPHATKRARAGSCAACHSNEGFIARNTSQRAIAKTRGELAETFVAPTGEVNTKTCSTCHDEHTFEIRAYASDIDGAPVTSGPADYSAQFNLCTACHQVVLKKEASGAYVLADVYADANYEDSKVGYHADNVGRAISDTHFAGTISKKLTGGGKDATGNDVLEGYGVNPSAADACSACHDVHGANKVVGAAGEEASVKFAEGIGATHGNYLAPAFPDRNSACLPCHSGPEFVKYTEGKSVAGVSAQFHNLGCVTCHDLTASDLTARRDFPENFVYKFQSGATVELAKLGDNQICFECHKGRDGLKAGYDTTTRVFNVNYLHYFPIFATLYGVDSEMHVNYPGKDYNGRFSHPDFAAVGVAGELGCSDCHDVHSGKAVITTDPTCAGCHEVGAFADAANLATRTKDFGDRLFATILTKFSNDFPAMLAIAQEREPGAEPHKYHKDEDGNIITFTPEQALKYVITGRNAISDLGSNELALAGAVWKNFMYDEPAAWAHNSKYARQVMFDAIQSLGGDTSGLTRP